MSKTDTSTDRRAQHVAVLGCVMHLVSFVVLLGLRYWAKSPLLEVLARFVAVGIPIWFVIYLVLNQIRRVKLESMETEELRRAQAAGTSQAIFDLDDEALLIEQRRLFWMVRWFFPGVTIFVSSLLVIGQLTFWRVSFDQALDVEHFSKTQNPTLMMWFVIGIGFLSFLYARYALAVARLPQWGLIRGGAFCMVGSSLASILVAVSLMATTSIEWIEGAATYVLGLMLLILGLELAVNFVLDLYRPRNPGEVPRPSFDSRLLGMIAEPGGFAKSIADAMNYQFGFQVSTTWFYQLLQRWLFPIMVVAFIVVLAMTSVVFVGADEQVIIEHFGQRSANDTSVLLPGIHLKWPYPVDVVYRTPVNRVHEMVIGEGTDSESGLDKEEHTEDKGDHKEDAVLWTHVHRFVPETMLLVASPKITPDNPLQRRSHRPFQLRTESGQSVAVSLMMVAVPIEYRVKNIHDYLNRYKDPEKILASIANQHLSEYAASVDFDRLIGPGRQKLNDQFRGMIQKRADDLKLGIEVVFAGVSEAHPPAQADVAKAFQASISAQTNMAATINAAMGEARKILIEEAGTEAQALDLDDAILARDRFTTGSEKYVKSQERVTELLLGDPTKDLAPISGNAAARIAQARGQALERISREAAKAYAYSAQVAGYRASPDLFKQRKRLALYANLPDIRKYLIVGDSSNVVVDYDVSREAGMDQVLSQGVEKERKHAP